MTLSRVIGILNKVKLKLYMKYVVSVKKINYVSMKLARAIGILNKMKLKLNMKYLVLVYNSLLYSRRTYFCDICGDTFNLNKICRYLYYKKDR